MNVFQKVTLKTLKENKTRTLVTIIGIVLSLSMFTAVTVSLSSFRNYYLNITIQREGNWHGAVPATEAELEDLASDPTIDCVSFLTTVGYAPLLDSENPDKPYLFIGGLDENALEILPLTVIEGRLPQNQSELLIPEHLAYNGGVSLNIGDTLSLEIGKRLSAGADGKLYSLGQETPYLYTEEELAKQGLSPEQIAERDTEYFSPEAEKTYQVVGIYQRPSIEPYSAPGYTALTMGGGAVAPAEDQEAQPTGAADSEAEDQNTQPAGGAADSEAEGRAYLRFRNPKDAIPWMEAHYPSLENCELNSALLRIYAASYETSFNAVLYRLAAILIFIIMFGSISLIYNAFSISVTERTRQFGLLSSVGATKRQLVRSVLFEAFALCVIGIPLGILAGIAGIGITFAVLGPSISEILYGSWAVPLTLHISPLALAVAAAIGLFTVLFSAWLPARRAAKLSPIDAIRQTADIAIRPGKVRTFPLTYRLFGLPGMLASKNFKRSRKKYRATVVSLFVSVVLFISVSSFCSYLTKAAENVLSGSEYDIAYFHTNSEVTDLSNDEILHALESLATVDQAAWQISTFAYIYFDEESLSREYMDFLENSEQEAPKRNADGQICMGADLYFINDDAYADYLETAGLSPEVYMDAAHPMAIASDFIRLYSGETESYSTFHLFSSVPVGGIRPLPEAPEGYEYNGIYMDENGEYYLSYYNEETQESLEQREGEWKTGSIAVGAAPQELPFFLGDSYSYSLTLLYPASSLEAVLSQAEAEAAYDYTSFLFTADDHKAATADISEALKELGLNHSNVTDYAESAAQERTLLLIVTVFSYGFIILISLIAMANVFNTISTNVQLRKREFAMLRSTGMTPKGFRVMMCYECLLYGAKGLLYGLPVSAAITWLIYRSISIGWTTSFYIPWYSLAIAIGSVFLVVGSTMVYSMHKIGRDNVVDALKDDNA